MGCVVDDQCSGWRAGWAQLLLSACPRAPIESEVLNRKPPRLPLTFRQPSVISRMFSTHGITLQPDVFTMLPAEILSRTHTPSKIKKTTATIWPYSKHRKHFSTFPSWWTKDKNKQGIIPNLALQRFFTRRVSVSFIWSYYIGCYLNLFYSKWMMMYMLHMQF